MWHQGHANGLNRQPHPIDPSIGQVKNGAGEPRNLDAGFLKGTEPDRKVTGGIRLRSRAVCVQRPIAGKLGA